MSIAFEPDHRPWLARPARPHQAPGWTAAEASCTQGVLGPDLPAAQRTPCRAAPGR